MTEAAPGSGDAVRHVPDPAVVAAYVALRADVVEVLTGWDPPDARQDRLRNDYLAHLLAHPDGCGEGRAAGAPHAQLPRARPGRRARAPHPAPQGERVVPVRRAPRARDPTLRAAARREACEECGHRTSRPAPHP